MNCDCHPAFNQLTATLTLATVVFAAGCGDDPDSGDDNAVNADNGNGTVVFEMPEVFESTEVSSYEEFQNALEDAGSYLPEDDELNDTEEAFLIEVVDDIDDGFDSDGELSYSGEVNLYIRGTSDRPTVDAGGESGILDLGMPSNPDQRDELRVWVEDLRFVGGATEGPAPSEGGAINASGSFSLGELFVLNCEFEDNQAIDTDGGAIATDNLYLDSSLFHNNHADDGRGGAVRAYGEATVYDSVFTDNSADPGTGGALSADVIDIEESVFEDNIALEGGPGSTNGEGGALRVGIGGSIDGSTFEGNDSEAHGGAIYRQGSTSETVALEITDSVFTANTSGYTGGAITSNGSAEDDNPTAITLADTVFESNSYDTDSSIADGGSAAYAEGEGEDIEAIGSSFVDNADPVLVSDDGELVNGGENVFQGSENPFE